MANFNQLKEVMQDRSATFNDSDGVPVFIADTLSFILDNARRSKQNAIANTTNGGEYRKLRAEIEMLDELLKGTIVEF